MSRLLPQRAAAGVSAARRRDGNGPGRVNRAEADSAEVRGDGSCPLQRLAYHVVRDEGVPLGAKLGGTADAKVSHLS